MADKLPPELTPEFLVSLVAVYRWAYHYGWVSDAVATEDFIREMYGALDVECPKLPVWDGADQWEESNGA